MPDVSQNVPMAGFHTLLSVAVTGTVVPLTFSTTQGPRPLPCLEEFAGDAAGSGYGTACCADTDWERDTANTATEALL